MKNQAIQTYLRNMAGVESPEAWKNKSYQADRERRFRNALIPCDIVIILGDYDCDGICASHILKKGIEHYYPDKTTAVILPDRFRDGYGIKKSHVDRIVRVLRQMEERGRGFAKPCIMTCDNGSNSMDVLAYAREQIPNLTTIVTDHHMITDMSVPIVCDVFRNPHYGEFEYENYCGAGVALKLIESLADSPADEDAALHRELVQYAGLATVADCVEIREDNWKIVREALDTMREDFRNHRLVPAFQKLFHEIGIEHPCQINEEFYGYKLGPLFNSLGRLLTNGATRMFKYLESPTQDECRFIMQNNQIRRGLVDENTDRLSEDILSMYNERIEQETVLFAVMEPEEYGAAANEGLCGLFAGKLAEKFGKPVIVLTQSREDANIYKGSARNVPGFDIHAYIKEQMDGYLTSFGGHRQACGLSMTRDDLERYLVYLGEHRHLSPEVCARYQFEDETAKTAIFLDTGQNMTSDYNEIQQTWAPFGVGFPEPSYVLEMDSGEQRFGTMGEGKHFFCQKDGLKCIHFNHDAACLENPEHFYMIGNMSSNYYRGNLSLQFIGREVCDEFPYERLTGVSPVSEVEEERTGEM